MEVKDGPHPTEGDFRRTRKGRRDPEKVEETQKR